MNQPTFQVGPDAFARFSIPGDWVTTVFPVFKKEENQSILIRTSVTEGSALYQSGRVKDEAKEGYHLLECTVPLHIPVQDTAVELDLNLFHPKGHDMKEANPAAKEGEIYRLINPEYLSPKVSIVTYSKSLSSANNQHDMVTCFVFVENRVTSRFLKASEEKQLDTAVIIVHMVKGGANTSETAIGTAGNAIENLHLDDPATVDLTTGVDAADEVASIGDGPDVNLALSDDAEAGPVIPDPDLEINYNEDNTNEPLEIEGEESTAEADFLGF